MLAGSDYRAFEIIGDSMLPTSSGSVIVGEKVEDLEALKNSNTYIVVSRTEGIVYKRIMKSNRQKNKFTLVSDNPAYQPYNIEAEDILEIWQAQMIISRANAQQRWDVNNLANLVNNLQQQVTVLKKKMN
jgi:SOS-response transcriptional repressor LexA